MGNVSNSNVCITAGQLQTAFVVGRCRPIVKALVRQLVKSRDKRADAEQEAYMRLIRRLPGYDRSRASLTSWAHVVSASAVLDFLRKEARTGDILHIDHEVLADRYTAPGPGPLETLLLREEKRLTPLKVRIVRYLIRNPYASKIQIARALGCDRATVTRTRTWLRAKGYTFHIVRRATNAQSTEHSAA